MSNTKTAKQKKIEKIVEDWNTHCPVGTRILVRMDDGSPLKSSTRSEAWIKAGSTPLIQVVGITGSLLLERVTAVNPVPPAAAPVEEEVTVPDVLADGHQPLTPPSSRLGGARGRK